MDRELRREFLKVAQSLLTPVQALARGLAGSAAHRISGLSLAGSATLPTATTAAAQHCVLLVTAPVEMSGLFDVRISAAVTGITTADSIDWLVSTDYTVPATPAVITSGTAFGAFSPTDANPCHMYTNHGVAGGITYTNGNTGAPGVAMYDTGAQVAVTSALNEMFCFAGTVGANITAGTGALVPFTKGNTALIALYTNISAGPATWQGLSVDVVERYA